MQRTERLERLDHGLSGVQAFLSLHIAVIHCLFLLLQLFLQ